MPSSTAVLSPGESRPWSWGRSQAWWRSCRSWSWSQLWFMVTSHCLGLNLWFLVICHCLGDLVQVLPGLMRSCRRRSRQRRPTGRHSSRCGRTGTGRGTQGLVNAGKWLFCTIDDGNRRTQTRLKTLNNKGFQTGEDKNMLIFITLWAWCMILDKTFSQIKNRSTWSDWKAVEMISSFSLTWSRALVARSSWDN